MTVIKLGSSADGFDRSGIPEMSLFSHFSSSIKLSPFSLSYMIWSCWRDEGGRGAFESNWRPEMKWMKQLNRALQHSLENFYREFHQLRSAELQLKMRLAGLHLQLKRVAHEQNTRLAVSSRLQQGSVAHKWNGWNNWKTLCCMVRLLGYISLAIFYSIDEEIKDCFQYVKSKGSRLKI